MKNIRQNTLKISVTEAAIRSDLPFSTYKRYEGGAKNMPQLDTLLKIARGLQTDLNHLIPQEHMSVDPEIWKVEMKLLRYDKEKRKKVANAIVKLIDSLENWD